MKFSFDVRCSLFDLLRFKNTAAPFKEVPLKIRKQPGKTPTALNPGIWLSLSARYLDR